MEDIILQIIYAHVISQPMNQKLAWAVVEDIECQKASGWWNEDGEPIIKRLAK